jgi:hypothetical protein
LAVEEVEVSLSLRRPAFEIHEPTDGSRIALKKARHVSAERGVLAYRHLAAEDQER